MAKTIRTKHATIKWDKEAVVFAVGKKSAEMLDATAAYIAGQARTNVVENDQVDTGFMLNAIYHASPLSSTYGQQKAKAEAENSDGEIRPEVALMSDDEAIVVAGAEYSIFQEIVNSFLYRAAQEAAVKGLGYVQVNEL